MWRVPLRIRSPFNVTQYGCLGHLFSYCNQGYTALGSIKLYKYYFWELWNNAGVCIVWTNSISSGTSKSFNNYRLQNKKYTHIYIYKRKEKTVLPINYRSRPFSDDGCHTHQQLAPQSENQGKIAKQKMIYVLSRRILLVNTKVKPMTDVSLIVYLCCLLLLGYCFCPNSFCISWSEK